MSVIAVEEEVLKGGCTLQSEGVSFVVEVLGGPVEERKRRIKQLLIEDREIGEHPQSLSQHVIVLVFLEETHERLELLGEA